MSKAFYIVQHEWIFLVLKKFGFGPRFIKFIKACTSNNVSKVALYDGSYSKAYQIGCGVRQGDTISPLLFALAIEPIVRAINNSPNIKGISTPSPKKLKISTMHYQNTCICRRHLFNWQSTRSKRMPQTPGSLLSSGSNKYEQMCLHPCRKQQKRKRNHQKECPFNVKETAVYLGIPFNNEGASQEHWATS
jgi:hypothetical protein